MTREEMLFVANGNELAADFIMAFVRFCHLMDDIVDHDKEVSDRRLSFEMLEFMRQLMLNSWVRDNHITLWPLIVVSVNAWIDSNEWHLRDKKHKRDADVLKGMYHEVVWWVAYLCGGWPHLRTVTTKYRDYQHERID